MAVVLDECKEDTGSGKSFKRISVGSDGSSARIVPNSACPDGDAATLEPPPTSRVELEEIEGQIVKVSISHDGGYCTAVALAPEMH